MYVRTLGSRTGRAHVVSCWPGAGEILRVRVRENVHGECRGAPLRVREHVRNYRKGKLRVDVMPRPSRSLYDTPTWPRPPNALDSGLPPDFPAPSGLRDWFLLSYFPFPPSSPHAPSCSPHDISPLRFIYTPLFPFHHISYSDI